MEQKLNKKKFLQRIIIVSWLCLAVCLIIKLCGGNWFEVACANKNFIAVCEYADTHLWLNYILSAVYCFISLYFFTLAILQRIKYKLWEFLVVCITVLGGTAIKVFWNSTAGLVFDVWQLVGMPILFLGKQWKSYWKIILANVLLIGFQLLSMYIKNIKFGILDGNAFVGMIYSIDVLIMVILFFAYANVIKNKINEKVVK